MSLTGDKIFLRRLSAGDLDFLYRWENDPAVWRYGDCGADTPHVIPNECEESILCIPSAPERFSRRQLREFIENQQHDVFETGQVRFVICRRDTAVFRPSVCPKDDAPTNTDEWVGFIDLFDIDPVELHAGVGILICDPADRRKGYGREALSLVVEYARHVLGLRSLWCAVAANNTACLSLFISAGFVRSDIPNDDYPLGTDNSAAPQSEIFMRKSL